MIKAEQPYSVIHQTNSDSDPNKLGSWERPPHNSNKITRQNLDDAFAVNNVFKDSINTGNSMWAPEGNSNDYFLKAKDNLVGQQNDRKIGDFLSQFHGMDYFRKGVPAMEEGLKGTGYDMGPSANIVKDNLKEAVDEGDTKEVENIIEEHPDESQEVLPEDTPIQEEAEQITDDTNKVNDEVNNEVVEDFVNDIRFKDIENKPYYDDRAKFDKANGINQDKKEAPGSSFMNIPNTSKNKRPNNQFHEYNEQEFKSLPWANDFMNANPISDKFAKAVAEADKYYGPDWTNKQLAARGFKIRNANDIENNIESGNEQDEVNDSNLPALNLQDYHKDLALNGERELSDDVDYRVVEDSDYIPPVYTIEDLDREIEEVSQWPVTNAEEAKEKQKKLKLLKSRKVAYGSTSTSDTNWNYDSSNATGGRVSPKAGIGSIGGASGHGSMATTKPTKMGDSHNSIASKAPLPHALEDNQGRVVSINGKATTAPSSNNNGAFRSGSFGLMSKAKSNLKPIPSKAPVSSGPEHKGSSMTANGIGGNTGEINVDDGKSALVERIKQLLAQLTDDEKKELGFSAESNTWNGKSLNKLDGYTLQGLIDKLENKIGGNK